MAESDQGRAKLNAGTAPIKTPKAKPVALKPDYVPGKKDDPIVHEAYAKTQEELRTQVDTVQTQGRQKGYSKAELDDVLEAQDVTT